MSRRRSSEPCRDPSPPAGTTTIAMASRLPGFSGRGHMTVRRALLPAALGRTWLPPGRRTAFDLYDAEAAQAIARRRLPVPASSEPFPPAAVASTRASPSPCDEVPEGWATTREICDALDPHGEGVPTLRKVRRVLLYNVVGPIVPDALDLRVCDAFDELFDRAGLPRLERTLPTERLWMGDRVERIFPKRRALRWYFTLHEHEDERLGRQMRVDDFLFALGLRGRCGARRLDWLGFVGPLLASSSVDPHGVAFVLGRFVDGRRTEWAQRRSSARAIADELDNELSTLLAQGATRRR
jgi:hypothetical protein